MVLPGGIVHSDGSRRRTYSWAPITGVVEEAVCDARGESSSAPELVAAVLQYTLATVGNRTATRDDVEGLSVVDQRSLMIELASRFGLALQWLTRACNGCGEPFDLPIDFTALPVWPAKGTYPEADVVTTLGRLRFRVPTGRDQIAIAGEDDDRQAIRALVVRCLTADSTPPGENWVEQLTDQDIEAISEGLEAVSPSLPWAAEARCPECGQSHAIPIDVAGWVSAIDDPIEEVHEIAEAYSWSERDILDLTRNRRQRYLSLIRRRNLASASAP
jgi:hypothetical protein